MPKKSRYVFREKKFAFHNQVWHTCHMRFQKIPYYLRKSIDEIVQDARQNITIHYITSR